MADKGPDLVTKLIKVLVEERAALREDKQKAEQTNKKLQLQLLQHQAQLGQLREELAALTRDNRRLSTLNNLLQTQLEQCTKQLTEHANNTASSPSQTVRSQSKGLQSVPWDFLVENHELIIQALGPTLDGMVTKMAVEFQDSLMDLVQRISKQQQSESRAQQKGVNVFARSVHSREAASRAGQPDNSVGLLPESLPFLDSDSSLSPSEGIALGMPPVLFSEGIRLAEPSPRPPAGPTSPLYSPSEALQASARLQPYLPASPGLPYDESPSSPFPQSNYSLSPKDSPYHKQSFSSSGSPKDSPYHKQSFSSSGLSPKEGALHKQQHGPNNRSPVLDYHSTCTPAPESPGDLSTRDWPQFQNTSESNFLFPSHTNTMTGTLTHTHTSLLSSLMESHNSVHSSNHTSSFLESRSPLSPGELSSLSMSSSASQEQFRRTLSPVSSSTATSPVGSVHSMPSQHSQEEGDSSSTSDPPMASSPDINSLFPSPDSATSISRMFVTWSDLRPAAQILQQLSADGRILAISTPPRAWSEIKQGSTKGKEDRLSPVSSGSPGGASIATSIMGHNLSELGLSYLNEAVSVISEEGCRMKPPRSVYSESDALDERTSDMQVNKEQTLGKLRRKKLIRKLWTR